VLCKQLERREREESTRKVSRYLERIDAIWELQSWLLDEADRAGIAIIESTTIEETVRAVLDLVIAGIMEQFPPDAGEEVLGA
jgi:2-phosphoglycerate kinase